MRNAILKASVALAAITWVLTACFSMGETIAWELPVMNVISILYIGLFALANRKRPRQFGANEDVWDAKGSKVKPFYNIVLDGKGGVK